jgi:hypothetical protein
MDERADSLKQELDAALQSIREQGASPERAEIMEQLCVRARRMLDHRHHFFGQMSELCRALSASLVELAEDDSWARGQCEAMAQALDSGLSSRGVRLVGEMLDGTRLRQRSLRDERARARDTLKLLIHRMLAELGELGQHTDRFQNNMGRYADVIEKADTLESLAGVVREMVEESRSVQGLVKETQTRLSDEHEKARELTERVGYLGVGVKLPWGNPLEKARAERIAAGFKHAEVLPKLNLAGVGKVLAGAQACVAVDTGLGHLAAALDVPTISLFGPTNPGLTGAYGKVQIHMASDFPCAPCLQKKCTYQPTAQDARQFDLKREQPLCFTRVNPERVASRLSTLLMAEELR